MSARARAFRNAVSRPFQPFPAKLSSVTEAESGAAA